MWEEVALQVPSREVNRKLYALRGSTYSTSYNLHRFTSTWRDTTETAGDLLTHDSVVRRLLHLCALNPVQYINIFMSTAHRHRTGVEWVLVRCFLAPRRSTPSTSSQPALRLLSGGASRRCHHAHATHHRHKPHATRHAPHATPNATGHTSHATRAAAVADVAPPAAEPRKVVARLRRRRLGGRRQLRKS